MWYVFQIIVRIVRHGSSHVSVNDNPLYFDISRI